MSGLNDENAGSGLAGGMPNEVTSALDDKALNEMQKTWSITLQDLIYNCQPRTPDDELQFNNERRRAFEVAMDVWRSRAQSYNQDRGATFEMLWGPVSLASELYKRTARMTSLLSPMRADIPLSETDIARLKDICVDMINYAGWQFALLSFIDLPESGEENGRPKVASIVPTAHLDAIEEDSYFMALSHACESEDYVKFFRRQVTDSIFKYVILDNSAVELGEPEPFKEYLEKAQAMRAHEVILPDYFMEAERTIEAAKYAIWLMKEKDLSFNIMAVPQGETHVEWMECLRLMLQKWPISTIGISKRYTEMFGGSRLMACAAAAYIIRAISPSTMIHLLGCETPPEVDVAPIIGWRRLRGVDSTWPAFFTKNGITHILGYERPKGEMVDVVNDDYSNMATFRERDGKNLLETNLAEWRNACYGQIPIAVTKLYLP